MKSPVSAPVHSAPRIFVIRLKPHEDLKNCLRQFAAVNKIKAAVILTCVGSLEQYNLRFANRKEGMLQQGPFEIVSLTGTLSASSVHLHLSVSDNNGTTTGGHLLDHNIIYTTAEIAIAELTHLEFDRVFDPVSGYAELQVRES